MRTVHWRLSDHGLPCKPVAVAQPCPRPATQGYRLPTSGAGVAECPHSVCTLANERPPRASAPLLRPYTQHTCPTPPSSTFLRHPRAWPIRTPAPGLRPQKITKAKAPPQAPVAASARAHHHTHYVSIRLLSTAPAPLHPSPAPTRALRSAQARTAASCTAARTGARCALNALRPLWRPDGPH